MSSNPPDRFRVAVLSVPKHAYVPLGIAAHPRFEIVVVADDADQPDWVHERNEKFARERRVPYVRSVERAIADYRPRVAVISSQAERHCDLAIRAAQAGLHIVQDKPMSTRLSECDRLLENIEKTGVRFLLWNRNCLPALLQARQILSRGDIGRLTAIHVDFYFAKDAGPPIVRLKRAGRKSGETDGTPVPGGRASCPSVEAGETPIPQIPSVETGETPAPRAPINWLDLQKAAHATGADGGVGIEPMGELKIEGIYPLAYIHMLVRAALGQPVSSPHPRVERVFARTAAHFHQVYADNNIEDLATVTLEMESGIVGSICLGRIGDASHPNIGEIKIHLIGSKGALVISEPRPEVSVYYRGRPQSEYPDIRISNENDWLLADDFARAIDTKGDTILDARAGRDICAIVEAALESARIAQPVEVPY